MKLSANIQKFRRSINISQEELAEKCGVSRQAVTKWETGDSVPALEKIVQLADIFEISMDELVGRIENNTYSRLMNLVKNFLVDDIPENEDDEASAIVGRYLVYMKDLNIDAKDILDGLLEIFCHGVE